MVETVEAQGPGHSSPCPDAQGSHVSSTLGDRGSHLCPCPEHPRSLLRLWTSLSEQIPKTSGSCLQGPRGWQPEEEAGSAPRLNSLLQVRMDSFSLEQKERCLPGCLPSPPLLWCPRMPLALARRRSEKDSFLPANQPFNSSIWVHYPVMEIGSFSICRGVF